VRQCVADFDIVAGYLRELESWTKQAEKRRRKREGLLQELVARLGSIRESFTGKPLNEKRGGTREFIHTCLDGLGERENSISNALAYVVDHPEEFRRIDIPDGLDEV
jgi:hypothetical protein